MNCPDNYQMVFACRNRRKWLNYRHFRIWDQMVDGFFIVSGPEKNSGKGRRAHQLHGEKFRSQREIFLSQRKNNGQYGPKKRRKPSVLGSLLFTIQIYNIFRQKANRINI
ncbi:hypothetical protein ST44_07715 [Prevotella pectinovora]|uniref:Uncharacterized protein n=1 Tax=Prevotella pectinovora TaxID=1602169 RepID=A0A0D0IVJ8_9BACT|nr:hypothetical protein ST44_07715 [Prevotella pectinovora]